MNYLVKNANHKAQLMSVSTTADELMLRLWARYDDPIDGFIHVNEDTLLTDVTEYPGQNVYIVHNGQTYQQKWYKSLRRNDGQLQVGGTYLFVSNDLFFYQIRVDSSRYPDVEISDWKFARMNSLRPLLKIQVTAENQSFADMSKVYYLHKDTGTTEFITADDLSNVAVNASDVSLLPEFTYQANGSTVTVSASGINGKLRTHDATGVLLNQAYNMVNGQCVIPVVKTDTVASFDLLFGFNKVCHVEL